MQYRPESKSIEVTLHVDSTLIPDTQARCASSTISRLLRVRLSAYQVIVEQERANTRRISIFM